MAKRKIVSLVLFTVMLLGSFGMVSASDSNAVLELVDFNDLTAVIWPTNSEAADYAAQLAAAKSVTSTLPAKGINLSHSNPDWLSDPMHYNIVDSGSARGKYLELIKQNTTDTSSVGITVPVNYIKNNDILVFEYDFKATGFIGVNYQALNVNGKDSNNTDAGLVNAYMSDSSFNFDPSGTGGPGYVANTWYKAKITLDLYTGKWIFTTQAEGSESVVTTAAYFPHIANATDKSTIQSVKDFNFKVGHICTAYGSSTASLAIDNIKAYTIDKMAISSSVPANGVTGVEIDKPVTITMNGPVDEDSLSAIVVKANGNTVTNYTSSASGNVITLNFDGGLEYGAAYEISLAGVENSSTGMTAAEGDKISFNTKAAPDVLITDVSYFKGTGEAYAEAESLAATGFGTASVTIKNTTSEAKSATVIFAIYKADGSLGACQYIQKDLAAGESSILMNGASLTGYAGGTVKIFSWDTPFSIKPWQKSISSVVAAN